MKKKKIFILLPDGVGLRNFAFTSFVAKGKELGWEIIFWNSTPFDLSTLNYKEIKLTGTPQPLTDLYKRTKINVELDHFSKKFNDQVYQNYKFRPSSKGIKNKIKNSLIFLFSKIYTGEKGLRLLRKKLQNTERKGEYYTSCRILLEKERPDYIFCTNQRAVNAVAPVTAAKDLGILTGSFIYSWDNLPKATLILEPDNYFVWSDHMKKELLKYYPHIFPTQIAVTGTPQFEIHSQKDVLQTREFFFKNNGLDTTKEYICFSGDDITTSPDDPQYLQDVAEAVEILNKKGYELRIIFRRCPVDFSNRYEEIIKRYNDLIHPIEPKWKKMGMRWNEILPTIEDQQLLYNTIYYSKAVINIGSSMIFDFAIFGKACIYLNYDMDLKNKIDWSTSKVYSFVHFRSMPSNNVVFWVNSKADLEKQIINVLNNSSETIKEAKKWFEIISQTPIENSSRKLWTEIEKRYEL